MLRPVALLSALVVGGPAAAEFQRIEARDSFVSIVRDRDLTRLGIRLNVTEDGKIRGKAFGQDVSGGWQWKGGYFCRDLYLNGDMLDGDNCQTVEVQGDRVRFTSDQGRGDSAELSLR
jgi:hypothetical protein